MCCREIVDEKDQHTTVLFFYKERLEETNSWQLSYKKKKGTRL